MAVIDVWQGDDTQYVVTMLVANFRVLLRATCLTLAFSRSAISSL